MMGLALRLDVVFGLRRHAQPGEDKEDAAEVMILRQWNRRMRTHRFVRRAHRTPRDASSVPPAIHTPAARNAK